MAFRIVSLGSDEADYSFYDLSRRCEPLETEYDDYMTYYEKMEFEKELTFYNWVFKTIEDTPQTLKNESPGNVSASLTNL